jgi:transcriptional regulator with XRE-family HTH domain
MLKKNIRLRNELFRRGMRQKDLAEVSGVSRSMISMAISGRYVLSENQQERIAAALGKPRTAFFSS